MSQVWLPHGVSVWGALGLSYEVTEKHGDLPGCDMCVGTGHGGGSMARSVLGLRRSRLQAALKVGSSAACAPAPGAALSTLGKPDPLRDGAGLGT